MTPARSDSYLNRQVDLLSRPEARAALRALKAIWGVTDDHAEPASTPPSRESSDVVGIWKRTRDADGRTSFVRAPETAGDWGLWADQHRIPEKSSRKRVVLLGESVARGYFFDPGFTVAQGLQNVLESAMGRDRIEVVDLACAGLKMPGLLALVQQTPVLRPDVIVMFCGNNWRNASTAGLSPTRRSARAGALLDGGIAALKAQCERELEDDVRAALNRLHAVFSPLRIPVVVVVPEFNLVDWREWDAAPGWLADDRNREWHALACRARSAVASGSAAATDLAAELSAIDEGSCAQAFYFLADANQQSGGERSQTRRFLEQARDCSMWDPSPLLSPRTFSPIQNTLRAHAASLGMPVVDLPSEFDAYLSDGLPDRRLFLDYCHLTKEGIHVAAAVTAVKLLPLVGARPATRDALLAATPNVKSTVEAVAHFGAAIHNAHWGQPRDLVEHHCARAIGTDRAIAPIMEDYLELGTSRAPAWMSRALDRMADRDDVALVRYIVSMLPTQPKLVDRDLLGALAATLGPDAERRLETLRSDAYAGDGSTQALHQPMFALQSLNQREAFGFIHAPADWPDWLRAYSRESTFALVEERPRVVELSLTARVPSECTHEGNVVVTVNGTPVLTAAVGARWTTWTVTVAAEHVRRGINELTVRWPEPVWTSSIGLARAVESIEAATTPELFPAFGEIHSFWAHHAS